MTWYSYTVRSVIFNLNNEMDEMKRFWNADESFLKSQAADKEKQKQKCEKRKVRALVVLKFLL